MSLMAFLLSFKTRLRAPELPRPLRRHCSPWGWKGVKQSGTLITTGVLMRVMVSGCWALGQVSCGTLSAPQSRCHYCCI